MAEEPTRRRTHICFPNAKVNLGLQVRNRRKDGFHNIESVFIPIGWTDTLEIEQPDQGEQNTLSAHGLQVPGEASENLIFRAHALLSRVQKLPPVHFHLIKAIPMGAGLGGGSADGAFAIKALNRHFRLGLDLIQQEGLAAELGSDCPFFIRNTTAHVTGRGEHIRPLRLDLDGWWMVVLHPGVHISTPQAFGWIRPHDQRPSLAELEGSSPSDWRGEFKNDFTAPITERFPEVKEALEALLTHGATFADMSGSGSAVFGCFPHEPDLTWLRSLPEHWSTWNGPMSL